MSIPKDVVDTLREIAIKILENDIIDKVGEPHDGESLPNYLRRVASATELVEREFIEVTSSLGEDPSKIARSNTEQALFEVLPKLHKIWGVTTSVNHAKKCGCKDCQEYLAKHS